MNTLKILFNRVIYLTNSIDASELWQLDYAWNFFFWKKSHCHDISYLCISKRKIYLYVCMLSVFFETMLCAICIVVYPSFLLFLVFSFIFIIALFLWLKVMLKKLKMLPRLPVIKIDHQNKQFTIFRRKNFPCVQIEKKILTLNSMDIKNIRLFAAPTIKNVVDDWSFTNNVPYFAIYMYFENKEHLIFVGTKMNSKIYTPVLKQTGLTLEHQTLLNIGHLGV